ncbi:MAG: IS1634 family transposase [Bacteroidia bacterium]|nr:IS1634 family transposase [Bacteroidia bacterium]
MFIKPFPKYNSTTKERYTIYRLCESYRLNGQTRHRTIVGLGKLDELATDDQKKLLGKRIEEIIKHGAGLLINELADEQVEKLAMHYYELIKRKRRYDVKTNGAQWETVNIASMKNSDAREIGAEWLCKQAFDQLGIDNFLKQQKWPKDKRSLAATHIISRAVYPASELKTVSFVKENSAISEITGVEKSHFTKDQLYKISHALYSIKDKLEQYLSRRTNDMFDLEDKIILYDLTNTYFEGRMKNSKLAKFGRSKEKRKDAKLIVFAAVINQEGFLKYTGIFEGNTADSKTLGTIIDKLSIQTSFVERKPIIVMDAGISTDGNLKMLKAKGYNYVCVSRSSLKKYHADTTSKPVEIKDKRSQPIELMKVWVDNDDDHYLWVKSKTKALKENSMNGLLSQRFEEGIQSISEGINKKGGIKKLNKVFERLGRLKQKYPSVHKYYEIIIQDDGKGTATSISCQHKNGEDPDEKAGIYFLRTTLDEAQESTIWAIYNIIREIESTFRILKTDLDLRPIYHKTDDASMAHLNLGLLAYWLVSTIRFQLKQKGFTHDWREIVRMMNTQKCVSTSVENIEDKIITVRQCTEPTKNVKQIYDLLNYKYVPFHRKKSVVPPTEIFKNDSS